MDTTRKISLLIGVLHLSEDAMSEVISHMDMVKSLRNRIKSGLKQGSLVRENQQPEEAQNMLQRAIAGEVALLQCLGTRSSATAAQWFCTADVQAYATSGCPVGF